VAEAVADEAAGELGEHVAGEEEAADQAAERERVLGAGQERHLGVDHVGDRRAGDRAVGAARHPAQEEPEPECLVARIRLAVALYVVGALAVTVVALVVARETAGVDPEEPAASGRRFVRAREGERTSTAAG
jgi:hypothetical protein